MNKQATETFAANVGGVVNSQSNRLIVKSRLADYNCATTETSKADNQTISESSIYQIGESPDYTMAFTVKSTSWSQSWAEVQVRFINATSSNDNIVLTDSETAVIGTIEYSRALEGQEIAIEVLPIFNDVAISDAVHYTLSPTVFTKNQNLLIQIHK